MLPVGNDYDLTGTVSKGTDASSKHREQAIERLCDRLISFARSPSCAGIHNPSRRVEAGTREREAVPARVRRPKPAERASKNGSCIDYSRISDVS